VGKYVLSKKAIVLISGGVDSLAALLIALKKFKKEEVLALYVALGSHYQTREILAVHKLISQLDVDFQIHKGVDLGEYEKKDSHIPYRNLFLAGIACYYLSDGGNIYLQNVQLGESNIGDRTSKFNRLLQMTLSEADKKNITIISPFANITKERIVDYVLSNHENGIELLKRTYSCFSGTKDPCGRCAACIRMWFALEASNLDGDGPISFVRNPLKSRLMKTQYIRGLNDGKYVGAREDMMKAVLKKHGVAIW